MSRLGRIFGSKQRSFWYGLALGVVIAFYLPLENDHRSLDQGGGDRCFFKAEDQQEILEDAVQMADTMDFEPKLNFAHKPMSAKKEMKNIVRPRYYSSELGIKEKIFIGVMSQQDQIDTLATALNKTSAHLVNKIKFFINADNVKSTFRLKNIVGFTDTRESLRPFHILKYIADNYLDDYDYFLIVPDTSYLDSRALKAKLSHISIGFDIYMGTPSTDSTPIGDSSKSQENTAQKFCELDAGIILSSGVIRKIRTNLDWCVRNANTKSHTLNIGRCVKYSTKIDECQTSWQGVSIKSFQLTSSHNGIYHDFNQLSHNKEFNQASVIYPINSDDDFYRLHLYFSRLHLEDTHRKLLELELNTSSISNGTIKKEILQVRWPAGVPPSTVPDTRYDLSVWTLMNTTHSFSFDPETSVKELSRIDMTDIQKILNRTLVTAMTKQTTLKYLKVHSIYRRFDPVRGMDYKILINFLNEATKRVHLIGYEVVKPLGMVEIIPSPYVTESTRVAIILPIFVNQMEESMSFMERYEKLCMANQDNTFLMLVFLYGIESPSKGDEDVFVKPKTLALEMSEKYKADGSRIAWVSIRLPVEYSNDEAKPEKVTYNSIYGQDEILSLAVTDLALRKIGLESLVMIASNSMQFKTDFLNRVRMNTIQGFQIFSPIGFTLYPCKWTELCNDCPTCDVSQSTGYFDRSNFDVVSFYSRDYVEARKKMESVVPIIRSDRDVSELMNRSDKSIKSVLDIFIKAKTSIHVLRAVEPSLKFGEQISNFLSKYNYMPQCPLMADEKMRQKCVRVASKKQFGEILIQLLGKKE